MNPSWIFAKGYDQITGIEYLYSGHVLPPRQRKWIEQTWRHVLNISCTFNLSPGSWGSGQFYSYLSLTYLVKGRQLLDIT